MTFPIVITYSLYDRLYETSNVKAKVESWFEVDYQGVG